MKITVYNSNTHTVPIRVRVLRDGKNVDTIISILPKSKPTLDVVAMLDNLDNPTISNELGVKIIWKEQAPAIDPENKAATTGPSTATQRGTVSGSAVSGKIENK